jgi:hypothetical protein
MITASRFLNVAAVLVAPGSSTHIERRVVGGTLRDACVFLKTGVAIISEGGPEATAIEMFSLGCGLIGALGQGCGAVAIEPWSWGKIKGAYR